MSKSEKQKQLKLMGDFLSRAKWILSQKEHQAFKQIYELVKGQSGVTKEQIFNFHQNLMTIVEDSETTQECHDREIKYIYHFLKGIEIEIED